VEMRSALPWPGPGRDSDHRVVESVAPGEARGGVPIRTVPGTILGAVVLMDYRGGNGE